MKIALLGYGKMGKAIEALLSEYGHTCVGKFNSENPATIETLSQADVAIEFSTPEQCSKNIALCFEANVPVVVGTTAWYGQYDEVISKMKSNSALLSATNFSIGVQITFHLNKELARVMSKFPEYTASIEEIHHTAKLDKPSGTAITLAEGILENAKNLTSWKLEEENGEEKLREGEKREEILNELNISALRLLDVPGTHTVRYTSEIDTIELKHEAHNRKGFAAGAIRAAEFIHGKSGVYTMKDVLNL
ncbi:MAG: 4-hydroxy-tetrahydrodipicolinate reductase [Flavobacteriales bacterium]|jgi:4-hydroxy-tetrahydrodipicolinate reductase|nr:4-hydroxy-tetrahydrodipicolinate reductase [Flavobacteriales bacterium]MDP4717986.1 4-hydroxy-tetrahydrodipicolinate reductase [Flavobacteriales bacterium]MDP4732053.1 4-hydroxy-tetrahydrodipicolinate reductase [Flavobacteriales bacterium]MDP4817379.1 4-hydroxy-tetrahydrodipicolinate reductase [Flavobacteriales bacterium]MDP4951061.1 4-hydroxy-tetrahydrodipicolinate reductase [Flavobacteriales bacterium]